MKQPSSIRNYARRREAECEGPTRHPVKTGKYQPRRAGFVPAESEKSAPQGSKPATKVNARLAEPGPKRRTQTALGLDEADNAVEAFALPEIGHDEWPLAPHPPG